MELVQCGAPGTKEALECVASASGGESTRRANGGGSTRRANGGVSTASGCGGECIAGFYWGECSWCAVRAGEFAGWVARVVHLPLLDAKRKQRPKASALPVWLPVTPRVGTHAHLVHPLASYLLYWPPWCLSLCARNDPPTRTASTHAPLFALPLIQWRLRST